MTVNTKKVAGRRRLRFEALDDILRDAEEMAGQDVSRLGNWSLGQVLQHLSATMNQSIDGMGFRAPWFLRLLAPLIKKRFLTKPLPAGFQVPKQAAVLIPDDGADTQDGLEAFSAAINRQESETKREPHPVLGNLTNEEWRQLHLRHAELHLGFIIPAESAE